MGLFSHLNLMHWRETDAKVYVVIVVKGWYHAIIVLRHRQMITNL